MPKAHETSRDLRKKISRATASHKSVKDKYREKQYELKKLKNCLSVMRTSRDNWRIECKKKEICAKNLAQELSNVSQERDRLIAKLKDAESLGKKK
jgi:hypothetical protein